MLGSRQLWDADGHINRFKVMVRPLKAIHAIHQTMGARLAEGISPAA